MSWRVPVRFGVLAVVAVCCWLLPPVALGRQLAVCVPLVAVFGLPHGAHDWALARDPRGPGLALLAALYAALGAVAVVIAWAAPSLALAAFLVLGVLHFGAEDAAAYGLADLPRMRVALGLVPILGPGAFWPGQTATLLHLLGVSCPSGVVQSVGLAGLLLSGVLILASKPGWRRALLAEQALLLALVAAAPPVAAFTAYFCIVHAPRHNRTLPANLQRWMAWPVTLACVLLIAAPVAVVAAHLNAGWVWASTNALFWGLAAVAWPHAAMEHLMRDPTEAAHLQGNAT